MNPLSDGGFRRGAHDASSAARAFVPQLMDDNPDVLFQPLGHQASMAPNVEGLPAEKNSRQARVREQPTWRQATQGACGIPGQTVQGLSPSKASGAEPVAGVA